MGKPCSSDIVFSAGTDSEGDSDSLEIVNIWRQPPPPPLSAKLASFSLNYILCWNTTQFFSFSQNYKELGNKGGGQCSHPPTLSGRDSLAKLNKNFLSQSGN